MLIEWQADVNVRSKAGTTLLQTIRNKNLREYVGNLCDYWTKHRPRLLEGNIEHLRQVIDNHAQRKQTLSTLRTRLVHNMDSLLRS